MDTPNIRKSSQRTRKSVSYKESPIESTEMPKSAKKSKKIYVEEIEEFSPKMLRKERNPTLKALESIVSENSPSNQEEPVERRRRSIREKQPTQLFTFEKEKKSLKGKTPQKREKEIIEDEEDIENFGSEISSKPTTLFDDNDVAGSALYIIKTPKRKDSMAQLAQRTPKTPRLHDSNRTTPKTPRNARMSEIMNTPTSRPSASKCTKTPRHIREALGRKLKKIPSLSDEDEDFSVDESESEANETLSSNESSQEDQENETPPNKASTSKTVATPSAQSSQATKVRRSARNKVDDDYLLQPDDYFSNAKAKNKTSNNTLDQLKNPRLPQDQLNQMLNSMSLSEEHELKIRELNEDHKMNFDYWLTLFDEGYTVLLHGFGSKRNLLINFHKERLAKRHVIIINGFFPSLTLKSILDTIWIDLIEMTETSANPHEVVSWIEKEMKEIPALHIFLIIHNLDGTMLRNEKAQSVLSRLASIKNIHMIASIDHINTPLLWNNTKLSNYNFVWFDCTSFLPYTDETMFEKSVLVQNSGTLELSSMKSVFESLTSNARGIFVLLVKHQLKNSGSPNYQGILFKDLYSACRDAFLVSSDVALRAHLTEFLDHKLAKAKRTIEGSEIITIPIKNSLLDQFLNEQ